ncbi:30S ribosomal protein S12 methylthiotransferase RimO [Thiohalomonas denitrificans]|uniref:Ribosomal protein uS12 methylthiotransferase RimO n=1 Tax=Thiohalomonas denitrificans TaxID=415747 RepID=A0A1G5PSM7_9GAMM|nr:30S ribosomal protein S12 methylthiotransferase RimO [Thiohalomonas denitrificans]SCZ52059.1 SSU ribosomal protein S12P methylthiotransferase [Thiohalomonas denitrificans]
MSKTIPKVGFVSLGCPKATVDSERILTQLRAEGYQLSSSYDTADLVVVNTCGFIDAAVEESLETIGDALAENGKVIVTGCLGARDDTIRAAHPQVLAVTGPDALDEVMEAVHAHLPPQHDPFTDLVPPGGLKLTPRHYAYIKIAEGCNQSCSFCIIPGMRGRLVSRPVGEVLDEAERLVTAGVRELLVVSQDTGAYGVDVKYRTGFWQGRPVKSRITDLARGLGSLGIWVRLHYLYPYPHLDELLPLMADGLILPYLDVPFQHASPGLLKAMRRPGDVDGLLRRIDGWRAAVPDLTLRSTFIVGFPGETDSDFERLLEFLHEARLDRVGAFAYSPVEGAAANKLPGAVSEELKEERLERFMDVQAAISADRLQEKVGRRLTVLVEGADEEYVYARSRGDAPEIDGMVVVDTDADVEPGEFLEVTITAADEHDLYAVPVPD